MNFKKDHAYLRSIYPRLTILQDSLYDTDEDKEREVTC